jgi:Flp pilus assembly secretin CpaC
MSYKFLLTTSLLALGLNLGLMAQESEISDDDLAKQAAKKRSNEVKSGQVAADSHFRRALKLYTAHVNSERSGKKADLNKARENLILALTYVSGHKKARGLLTKVNSALGVPEDKTADLLEQKRQSHNAFNQQQQMEIKQSIYSGRQLIVKMEYAKAQRELKKVLEVLDFLPYHINTDEYRRQIDVLIIEAKGKKHAEEQNYKIEQQRMAEAMVEQELYKNQEIRRNRIQHLTEQADDRYLAHDYKRAIDLYKIVRKIDPRNEHAREMIGLSNRTNNDVDMAAAKYRSFIDNETRKLFDGEGFILQDPNRPVKFPDDFKEFTERRSFNARQRRISSEEDWKTRLRGILDRPATIPLESQPLEQVITKLMITYDVIIVLGTGIDPEEMVDDIPVVNLTFKQVLEILVSKIEGDELGWSLKYGTIFIGPSSDFKVDLDIVNYDVRDLVATVNDYAGPQISMVQADESGAQIEILEPEEDAPSGDDFVELIRNATGEQNWEDPSNIEYRNGSIVVNNTATIHEQIDEILTGMRAQRNLQVTVKARFLRLNIYDMDFIGSDLNGLAAPPVSPWNVDTLLQDYPANDTLSNIDNDLGFNRNSGGRNLFRGRTQNFVGLTYQLDNQNNGVVLNQGLGITWEYLNDIQVAGLLRAVSNKKHSNFLVAPMLTCFNTQRANVAVLTQQAYIRDLTAVTQSGAGLFDPEIGYIQTGVSLDVRPIVSHDRKYVTLDMRPTIAELERIDLVTNTAGNIAGSAQIELPVISYRAVRTTVSVPDRGSILIGGFSNGEEVDDYSGIPFLSKIPILNMIFGSALRKKEMLNDYLLVKATIVSQTQLEEEQFGME